MFDVICVGSSTVDVFARTEFSELVSIRSVKGKKAEEKLLAYPIGGKILIEELDFTTGGGGTNVAVALSRLGLQPAYFGAVGDDANAGLILDALKKDRVDTHLVVSKKGKSGYSIILDSIEHDRTILTHKGVNNDLRPSDVKKAELKAKWFYFSAMMEQSFSVLEDLAKFAKRSGIKVAFNPSSYLAEKGAGFLKTVLSATTLLVLNKEESELIAGAGKTEDVAQRLHLLGPEYVVITDGKNGAYCSYDGTMYFAPTHHVKVVETTGAGDAFASTFLAGLILGADASYSLALATTNAESVVTHHGAKSHLLTLREATAVLKKCPVHVTRTPLKR
ncbi:MAG: carbohydrate kinase family protein [Nanoarchaeota archaeon]|nr:carbohydrate kinase family protein [Nanoarchaeota archaeon]